MEQAVLANLRAHVCCELSRAEDVSINTCSSFKAQGEKGKEYRRGGQRMCVDAEEQEVRGSSS